MNPKASQPMRFTPLARVAGRGSGFSRLTFNRIAGTAAGRYSFDPKSADNSSASCAEEPVGHEDLVNVSQAIEREVPQAAAHRIAHQQAPVSTAVPAATPSTTAACVHPWCRSKARIRRRRDMRWNDAVIGGW